MSSRSFFQILLKVFAMLIFLKLVEFVVQLAQLSIYSLGEFSLGMILLEVFPIGIFVFFIYTLLFKCDYIINKFKLLDNIDADVSINMHRSDVLSIAIIVLGGYVLIDEIPVLFRTVYSYWWEGKMEMGYSMVSKAPFFFSGAKILVGLLLLGNTKMIVNYIELRRKK
ncbi:hypothetical protein CAP35_03875 [Chitinophagaceae bacterium IBVUCB1]|nr:hypothetical protein CAP35_03875 [Chitinophagaceae bacterium IBVUCB1]